MIVPRGNEAQCASFVRSGETPTEEVTIMRTLIAASALIAATLLAGPAVAQTGSGQFCLKSMTGDAKCNYQTMAQCEQAKSSNSADQCVSRSQLQGTTGSGAGSTLAPGGSRSSPSPGSGQSR
jgi:hypothetical protein